MKFRHADIEFPDKGLVLVQGINSASGGALSSVGSGKTGFGEAICRTLLGTTGRFVAAKKISRNKNGDTYVRLEAELHGRPLLVEYGYACDEMSQTGEALRYTYDGKPHERGRIQQTRADLSALLGVTPLLADWTVFVDGSAIRFDKLSQADCVDLTLAALKQPPWGEFFEAAKVKAAGASQDVARESAAHQSALRSAERAKSELADAVAANLRAKAAYDEALRSHQSKLAAATAKSNAQQAEIDTIQARMKEIRSELKKMEDALAAATHALEVKLHALEDKAEAEEAALDPLRKAKDQALKRKTEAQSNYRNYTNSASNCPTCRRPKGELDPERVAALKQAEEIAEAAYNKAELALETASSTVKQLVEERRSVSKELRSTSQKATVQALSDEYGACEDDVDELRRNLERTKATIASLSSGPDGTAVIEAETLEKAARSHTTNCQATLDAAAKSLLDSQLMSKIVNYWYNAYSPYGIPNMVLREAIGPLNHEARRVSAAMTGGTINVQFSTTRELAGGREKAQLNISVENRLGDEELAGSSKGESGLTNFIVSETLSEVGQISRRIGFRWYDEIVPHQDVKVCQSLYSYMRDAAERLGVLIFLVDHNPVAANYADHVLVVEKLCDSHQPEDPSDDPSDVHSTARWI